MAHLVRLLVVLVVCAPCFRIAQGAERLVDALTMYALQERTAIADGLEKDILAVIENSPNEDRFDLYRTYNQLMGTWVQVDLSQTLVKQVVAATSPSECPYNPFGPSKNGRGLFIIPPSVLGTSVHWMTSSWCVVADR